MPTTAKTHHGPGKSARTPYIGPVHIGPTAPAPTHGKLWLDTSVAATNPNGVNVITTITENTVIDTTYTDVMCDATGGSFTATLPAGAGNEGRFFGFKKIDSSVNTVTIAADGSDEIDDASTFVLYWKDEWINIEWDGTQWRAGK